MILMKHPFFLLLSLTLSMHVYSQNLVEVSSTKILFGLGENQVGVDKGGGEHWKPLFFSVDKTGVIHIPDFYKNRIVLFDVKGKLVKVLPVKEGISPRMNYFALAYSGRYVSFGDYTLFLLASDGSLVWKRQFGYGAIPEAVFANGVGIFLVLPDDDGRAIIFDYASDRPLGRYGFMDGKKGVPMIRSAENANFTFTFSYMSRIPNSISSKSAFQLKEDAFLVAIDASNRSLWKKQLDRSESIWLFSDKGALVKQGTIAYSDSSVEGNGFWTFADENMTVYKNYFYEDYMIITGYRFK
jgi:hypothetical protein